MRINKTIALGTILASLSLGAAHAQSVDPKLVVIDARQSFMSLVAFYSAPLGAMDKGSMPYDAAAASAAANQIVALTSLDQTGLWEAGTDRAYDESSLALSALWEPTADLNGKLAALRETSLALQAAAGTDLATMQTALASFNDTCKACHGDFKFKPPK
ncbi:cytochrome c [Phaeovulum sp.]|uniref:c-type cytochrome n=1 Tax=Phaeovulum sp. TaxID=2934796 RepID=UPI003568ECF2